MGRPADRIAIADRRLRAYVLDLFRLIDDCDIELPPYEIVASGRNHQLMLEGEPLRSEATAEALIGPLVQDLNRRVIEASPHLMVHAGGVERGDVGLVLAGAMEAGKTTLTAGLVRAGFGYLTDEAVAIDRDLLVIHPYPKPLSLDPGSWPLFPQLEPSADLGSDDYKNVQWQVPAQAIRRDVLGRSCPVRFVIFPRYEADATTAIEPLGRAEALVELTRHTFGFKYRARESLDQLAEVVRGAECHRLTMGDLEQAVELVTDLVAPDDLAPVDEA